MLGIDGVTAIETNAALVTVSVVLPDIFVEGSVAFIVVEPTDNDEASPWEPLALLMVATEPLEDIHIVDVVKT